MKRLACAFALLASFVVGCFGFGATAPAPTPDFHVSIVLAPSSPGLGANQLTPSITAVEISLYDQTVTPAFRVAHVTLPVVPGQRTFSTRLNMNDERRFLISARDFGIQTSAD